MIRLAGAQQNLRIALFLLLCPFATHLWAEPLSRHIPDQPLTDSCLDGTALDGRCTLDSDGDDVPDYRDICLNVAIDITALQAPEPSAGQKPGERQVPSLSKDTGCVLANPLVLPGVRFRSGQSYLDVASRNVLDRVAHALRRMPPHIYEISSHTDNAGRVDVNQQLSENRAKAVRHYLILRGVNPGQLNTRGHGETSPAFSNVEAAGRRANRRTELRRLD